MQTSDFDFNLPQNLIAQYPCAKRSASRLLYLDQVSGAISHKQFIDLPNLLLEKDLLIFNDTRVIPARLFGIKDTGGQVEILIERILDARRVLAQLKFSKAPQQGSKLILANNI